MWEQQGSVAPGATQALTIPINEDGLTDAVFSVNWAAPATAKVRLFKPNNVEVTAGGGVLVLSDGTHTVFQLPQIDMTGDWRLEVLNTGGGDLPFTAAFSAKGYKGVKMQLFFGQTPADPLGSTLDKVFLKGLADAGDRRADQHQRAGDGREGRGPDRAARRRGGHAAAAGRREPRRRGGGRRHLRQPCTPGPTWRARLAWTTAAAPPGTRGSYNVIVTATGKSDTGEFTRIRHGSFQVYELNREQGNPDGDQDGMPDRWEGQFTCLSAKLNDAKLDPDGDGLANLEEYQLRHGPVQAGHRQRRRAGRLGGAAGRESAAAPGRPGA